MLLLFLTWLQKGKVYLRKRRMNKKKEDEGGMKKMKLIISKDSFIDEKEIVIEPSEDDRYRVDGIIVAHRCEDGDLHIALGWLKKAISNFLKKRTG